MLRPTAVAIAVVTVLISSALAEDLVSVSPNPATIFLRPTDAPTCPPAGTRGIYFDASAGKLHAINSSCTAVDIETGGAGGGAPEDAEYWVGAPDATLTAEHDLSALADALVRNTSGVPSAYGGSFCAGGTFTRSISATGVISCESVDSADIDDGSLTADDLGADSVSASELNATGVEAELEAVIELQDLQGAVTDAQVPDGITVTLAATATALAANGANCADATHFAVGVNAAGAAECEAIADADVPNTITVDLATLATTATTANAGDSATAFFPAGTLEVARGGTGSAPAADDQVLISDSTVAATWRSIPNCTVATQKLLYATATNTWSCQTDATGGGGSGNSAAVTATLTSVGMFFTFPVLAAWAGSTVEVVCRPHGEGTTTVTAETLAVAGINVTVGNVVDGNGFDVMVSNPYGLEGDVEIHCLGV